MGGTSTEQQSGDLGSRYCLANLGLNLSEINSIICKHESERLTTCSPKALQLPKLDNSLKCIWVTFYVIRRSCVSVLSLEG